MKYIKQFGIILIFSFIGELMHIFIPLKIPASIYGLVLLFTALALRIIKLESVHETGKFLIEIMPLMFIPAGVGLLTSWGILKPICIPVIVITVVSTILVMGVSGSVTQLIIRHDRLSNKRKNEHIYMHESENEKHYISEDEV